MGLTLIKTKIEMEYWKCVEIYRFLPLVNILFALWLKKWGRGKISTDESSNLSYLHFFDEINGRSLGRVRIAIKT